jgi:phage-related protein
MLDAVNLRELWHKDQSKYVFGNTMIRRDESRRCMTGCRMRKEEKRHEGLLGAVSIFGLVLL